MTTTTTTTHSPDREVRPILSGWQVVTLVALALGCAFALLLLLPEADRRQVLSEAGGVIAPYVAPVLAAVAAAVAAWAARSAKHETARQTPLLQTAVAQTNGALTRRDDHIRELEAKLERALLATPAPDGPSPAGEGPSTATMPAGFTA